MLHFSENNCRIAILGDVHGKDDIVIDSIQDTINYCKLHNIPTSELMIQVGDFDCYSHKQLKTLSFIAKKNNVNIVFIPGNHEDWDKLNNWSTDNITIIRDNIYYAPVGSSALINNKKSLFLGGAVSPTQDPEVSTYPWYPQESMDDEQYNKIIDTIDNSYDIVFSHDSPRNVPTPINFTIDDKKIKKDHNTHRTMIQHIVDKAQHSLLFHGHYHNYYKRVLSSAEYSKSVIGLGKENEKGSLLLLNTENNSVEVVR